MRLAGLMWLWPVIATVTAITSASTNLYNFQPENATSIWEQNKIPILFSLNETQRTSYNGSWWTSSYLTTEDSQQYFVFSQFMTGNNNQSIYRSSVLDLADLSYSYSIVAGNGTTASKRLLIQAEDNGFEALSDDNIARMRTWSNNDNTTFDITWNATSVALVDGGTGSFALSSSTSYQWGLPGCRTAGTLTIDETEKTIDPTNSMTWYDRQWGTTGVSSSISALNWTWHELHLPNTADKLSIWAIDDNGSPTARFATIRARDGSQYVVPATFTPDYGRTYESSNTGTVYPLDWTVEIGNWGSLRISSVAEDQEVAGSTKAQTIYEGFVTFVGDFNNQAVAGYGLV
ncbi:hypothetical protein BO70DRAFT_405343 [Aspergillus heteromorphus CBS 117.55]|uniref:AttH domain-containing protein n=1 Tax=Aspergillus heteromorphus CBS 117.55 TaxID=1448321 RepID=A0A317W882_9EURO|nr:uncharacterized protein BO70DRAFT_405343 [Aspergillus heteromorphus CBS 117.55]PWY82125.1 hypothetical protein BO70DRAFT_405343 [Aspergillus heteromorphus CBS 117.55]